MTKPIENKKQMGLIFIFNIYFLENIKYLRGILGNCSVTQVVKQFFHLKTCWIVNNKNQFLIKLWSPSLYVFSICLFLPYPAFLTWGCPRYPIILQGPELYHFRNFSFFPSENMTNFKKIYNCVWLPGLLVKFIHCLQRFYNETLNTYFKPEHWVQDLEKIKLFLKSKYGVRIYSRKWQNPESGKKKILLRCC